MATRPSVTELIRQFNLKPLPAEGGLFVQSYVSEEMIPPEALPGRYQGVRKPFGTAIFYLLTSDPDSFSALHRLPTDEIYHFYLGDPVEMLLLYPDGSSRKVILGQDIMAGQFVQWVVPRGVWQGSRLVAGGEYALLGTTMAPGFTPEDYEGGDRDWLMVHYPHEAERISRLTREVGRSDQRREPTG